MKRSVLILVTFFLFASAYSQTHEIDSLKELLRKEKTDTGRVILLAELAFRYHGSTPDTAMTYAMQALDIAVRINYKKGEAISLNRIGNVYLVLGNHSKALEVWLKALKINEQIGNLDGQRRNMNNIGLVFKDYQGDNRKALSYFLKCRQMAVEIKDEFAMAVADGNLAETYKNLKIFDSAKLYAQQCLNKSNQFKSSRGRGTMLMVFGEIYFDEAQYPLALEYCRMSTPELMNANNFQTLSRAFLLAAKIFEKQGQKDSSLFYAKRAISLAIEKRFLFEVRDAAKFLSYQYRNSKPDSAFFYQDLSTAVNDSLFNEDRSKEIQSMEFDEKMRQQELAAKKIQEAEERNHNLQYSIIALALVSFVILFFLLSHSIIANQRLIKFLGILALLIVFEFINLFIHPYLEKLTGHSVPIMLCIMVAIAALLIPLHHKLEHWITHKLVEKNKKIRLAAAKKTIAKLEGGQTN